MRFQLLLKGCTIEASKFMATAQIKLRVSVVVERMYDWSLQTAESCIPASGFQLLLKGCTIEAVRCSVWTNRHSPFQLLLKGCTIEARRHHTVKHSLIVSVVVERMYDWSTLRGQRFGQVDLVSVVVERMYDWSIMMWTSAASSIIVSVVVERMYDWSLISQI